MITRQSEYLYVSGGDFSPTYPLINGEIKPLRSGNAAKVLRGEDICFLIEAMEERRNVFQMISPYIYNFNGSIGSINLSLAKSYLAASFNSFLWFTEIPLLTNVYNISGDRSESCFDVFKRLLTQLSIHSLQRDDMDALFKNAPLFGSNLDGSVIDDLFSDMKKMRVKIDGLSASYFGPYHVFDWQYGPDRSPDPPDYANDVFTMWHPSGRYHNTGYSYYGLPDGGELFSIPETLISSASCHAMVLLDVNYNVSDDYVEKSTWNFVTNIANVVFTNNTMTARIDTAGFRRVFDTVIHGNGLSCIPLNESNEGDWQTFDMTIYPIVVATLSDHTKWW